MSHLGCCYGNFRFAFTRSSTVRKTLAMMIYSPAIEFWITLSELFIDATKKRTGYPESASPSEWIVIKIAWKGTFSGYTKHFSRGNPRLSDSLDEYQDTTWWPYVLARGWLHLKVLAIRGLLMNQARADREVCYRSWNRTTIETQKMLKSSVNILSGSASHGRDITGRRYRLQEASVIIHLSAKAHVSNGWDVD